jgi:hypothetical protein
MTFVTVTLAHFIRLVHGKSENPSLHLRCTSSLSGASQMSAFILFHVYLILMITSPVVMVRSFIQRNTDILPSMAILFFLSLIGLSCNYAGFIRQFCAIYDIVLLG